MHDAKSEDACSFISFVSEISEGVASQLHIGIMKAARRVVLDEIISNIISEFVTIRKNQKQLKLESLNQDVKTCFLDGIMVMNMIVNEITNVYSCNFPYELFLVLTV